MELHKTEPKFTSHTHLGGYVLFRQRLCMYYFWEDVHLELHTVLNYSYVIKVASHNYERDHYEIMEI